VHGTTASLALLLVIAITAKQTAAPDARPDAAKQPGGRSEIRAVQTAHTSLAAGEAPRPGIPFPTSALPGVGPPLTEF
jgi:hypothetical protein